MFPPTQTIPPRTTLTWKTWPCLSYADPLRNFLRNFEKWSEYMKYAHCAEWSENSIFRFFQIFIFWVMIDCVYNLQVCHLNFLSVSPKKNITAPKDAQCSETVLLVLVFFFVRYLFSFWDMVDFLFNIRSEMGTSRFLQTWIRDTNQWYPITNWLGGFNPKASGAWGRRPW